MVAGGRCGRAVPAVLLLPDAEFARPVLGGGGVEADGGEGVEDDGVADHAEEAGQDNLSEG